MDKLLTTNDIAERWQCSIETVRSHVNKGLKAIPLSKKDYRYTLQDVIAYEEHLKDTLVSFKELDVKAKSRFDFKSTNQFKLV